MHIKLSLDLKDERLQQPLKASCKKGVWHLCLEERREAEHNPVYHWSVLREGVGLASPRAVGAEGVAPNPELAQALMKAALEILAARQPVDAHLHREKPGLQDMLAR